MPRLRTSGSVPTVETGVRIGWLVNDAARTVTWSDNRITFFQLTFDCLAIGRLVSSMVAPLSSLTINGSGSGVAVERHCTGATAPRSPQSRRARFQDLGLVLGIAYGPGIVSRFDGIGIPPPPVTPLDPDLTPSGIASNPLRDGLGICLCSCYRACSLCMRLFDCPSIRVLHNESIVLIRHGLVSPAGITGTDDRSKTAAV